MSNNFFHLDNRAVIKVSGSDAKKFLQGLLTNDTSKISNKSFIYSYMLSPQGRILFDFFITEDRDAILLDCPKQCIEEIIKKLSMYRLKSNVMIEDASEELKVYISPDLISERSFQDPRNKRLLLRTISKPLDAGDKQILDKYHSLRIAAKIPDYDLDITYNRSLPEELGAEAMNAVSFSKGCYVGQEVTARLHHRGKLRKFIHVVLSTSGDMPQKESELFLDTKKIGVMLGAYKEKGLALINLDEIESDSAIGIQASSNNALVKILS